MPGIEWVEPALVWKGRKLHSLLHPRLAEFETDNFMAEFIEAMSATGKDADPVGYLGDHLIAGDSEPRLFQPLHGRYYLVTGSLVCRQAGLPDKVVDRASGESVSFVLRRTVTNAANITVEQGWVDEGPLRGWHEVVPGKVLRGEERFPMHPLTVCTASKPSQETFRPVDVCLQERTIYHGYLPTGNREKYLDFEPGPAFSTPQDYIEAIENQSSLENFRYNEFERRVAAAWKDLLERSALMQNEDDRAYSLSLYLILDLGDYLNRTMPQVWNAVINENINLISESRPNQRALYTTLDGITIGKGSGTILLRAALEERKDDLALVNGEGTEPGVQYDVRNVSMGALESDVRDALDEETSDFDMPAEMTAVLHNLVRPEPTESADSDTRADHYFIRLVYDYKPQECPPVMSDESQRFTFARFFESDAPARHIRLELPSISMQDLRRFKRGVGMQMSPALRKLMGRVNEGMLEGEGPGPEGPGWELGMICTFSLQIIFLVAFIVMFIFLILLNIIFWWLPFLKICFPIPRRGS